MGNKVRTKVRKKANSLLERVHIFRIGIRVQVFELLEKRKEAGAGLLLAGLVWLNFFAEKIVQVI